MKNAKTEKPFWEMTHRERTEAVKEFDKPLPAERFRPLTKAERARFERARRAGGLRSREIVAFDIDPKLASETVKYARRKKMTVSQVVERGLRRELAVVD